MNERKAVKYHDRLVAALRNLHREVGRRCATLDAPALGEAWINAGALLAEIESSGE